MKFSVIFLFLSINLFAAKVSFSGKVVNYTNLNFSDFEVALAWDCIDRPPLLGKWIGWKKSTYCGGGESVTSISDDGEFVFDKVKVKKGNSENNFQLLFYVKGEDSYFSSIELLKQDLKNENYIVSIHKMPKLQIPTQLASGHDPQHWLSAVGRMTKVHLTPIVLVEDSEYELGEFNTYLYRSGMVERSSFFFALATDTGANPLIELDVKVRNPELTRNSDDQVISRTLLMFPLSAAGLTSSESFITLPDDAFPIYITRAVKGTFNGVISLDSVYDRINFQLNVVCENGELEGHISLLNKMSYKGSSEMHPVTGPCDNDKAEIHFVAGLPASDGTHYPVNRYTIKVNEVYYISLEKRLKTSGLYINDINVGHVDIF